MMRFGDSELQLFALHRRPHTRIDLHRGIGTGYYHLIARDTRSGGLLVIAAARTAAEAIDRAYRSEILGPFSAST